MANKEALMEFEVIVHPEEDGGYWAEVPAITNCFTEGKTMEELEYNLREVIALMLDLPDPVPDPAPGDWNGGSQILADRGLVKVTV